MNKNKYNRIRLYYFLKGLFLSMASLFFPRKRRRIIFSSEFNLFFNHCSKYLFLYFIDNYSNDYEIKFVINDDELRSSLNSKYGNYFIETKSVFGSIYALNAKTWVTSSLETPVGGLFNSINRVVIHLGHGAPLKAIGLQEKYINVVKLIYYNCIRTNFSYFISTSPMFDHAWAGCLGISKDRVFRGAQCRNDNLSHPNNEIIDSLRMNKGINILYAPTWRPFGETKLFPFDDFKLDILDLFLKRNNYTLYLRIHPNFEASYDQELLELENISLLSKNTLPDINQVLGAFDILITDYSSIYIDFLVTEKPMLFLPYDICDYANNIGFSIDYHNNTPGPKPTTFIDFMSEMEKLLKDKSYFLADRKEVNERLNPIQSHFTETTAKAVITLAEL